MVITLIIYNFKMFFLLRCVPLKKYLPYTANNIIYSNVYSSNLKLGYISECLVQLTYFDCFLDNLYTISACLNEIY